MSLTSFVQPTQPTVAGGPIVYSDYQLDASSPYAGGAAWIDGEYVPIADAKMSILDDGFSHSHVTYTVAHVWHGKFFRLSDHIDRFLSGATSIHLTSPFSKKEIMAIGHRVVALSQLRESYVNFTLTVGINPRSGQDPRLAKGPQLQVYATTYRWNFPPTQQVNGVSAAVPVAIRRNLRNQIDPQVKNYQWGDLTQGLYEAKGRGADTAILLDQNELVAEGPGFNVLIVKDGKISSPAASALPGVTRRTALELATADGIATELRDVASSELYSADEIFITTTAGGVTPVIELDGKPVGAGAPGPITVQVQARYWRLMDEDSELLEPIDYSAA